MDSLTTTSLLQSRRTRIVATLGPASEEESAISRLIRAGVSVFRLNLSHGDHDWHRTTFQRVRAATRKEGVPVALLMDLSGTKIRCGELEGGEMELADGETVTLTTRPVKGSAGLIPCGYENLVQDVEPGVRILLDDGSLALEVTEVKDSEVLCRVTQGGVLRERVGMHLPGVRLSTPALTDKDRDDAALAVELEADFLALSFVRRADDLRELRQLVEQRGGRQAILAKIEKAEALEEIDDIIQVSDGILVARGDLGVELEPERLPVIQNELVDKAREQSRPVIIATQMLESMVDNNRPTRAEVTDVAHAVSTGADAVMLSRETALGRYPVQAVEMMDRVARHSEGYLWAKGAFQAIAEMQEASFPLPLDDAVARATAQLSRDLLPRSILVISHTGTTAARVSSARPAAPIIVLTPDATTCRQMNLLWGLVPIQVEAFELEEPKGLARRLVQRLGLAEKGDSLLMVRGFHQDPQRNAPSITVFTI